MKIVTKVSLGYAVGVVLILLVGLAAFLQAQTTKTNADRTKSVLAATRVTKQFQIDATAVAVAANSIAYDYASHGSATGDYQSFVTALADSQADSAGIARLGLTPAEAVQLKAADKALAVYAGQTKQLNADFKQNTKASVAAGNQLVAALAFHTVIDPLEKLVALRAAAVNRQVNSTSSQASTDEVLVVVGVLAALLFAVGLSVKLSQAIRRPLEETGRVLDRVAEGDLTVRLDWHTDDEFGAMAAALNTGVGTMHDVIAALEGQADALSAFADRAASHTSADEWSADAEGLSQQAATLSAMISIFTLDKGETPASEGAADGAHLTRVV